MTEPMNESEMVEIKNEEQAERGASMVEYALLVALIAIVAIAAVRVLGQRISAQFSQIEGTMAS